MRSAYDIPDLNKEQFAKFAQLIHKKAFITLKEHKVTLLSNRLRRRLNHLGLDDYDHYYDYLTCGDAKDEMSRFFEEITTNETYFWRAIQNFELLKKDILPRLLENHSNNLSFWSAGCSSGEEPYNLVIEIIEAMKVLGSFDFKVRASDLSERVISFAKEGRYHGRKIEKVPPVILRRYFRNEGEKKGYHRIREDIKQRITFHVENLFESDPGLHHCIFCRNVMIYFSREDQLKLAQKFYNHLEPGGFLVIGHSESLHMFEMGLEPVQLPHGVVYHKPLV